MLLGEVDELEVGGERLDDAVRPIERQRVERAIQRSQERALLGDGVVLRAAVAGVLEDSDRLAADAPGPPHRRLAQPRLDGRRLEPIRVALLVVERQRITGTKASVALPPVSLVIPERVHRHIRMQSADGIDPALIEQLPKQSAWLWLDKRILGIGLGGIDVGVSRHNIEIAGENDRCINAIKFDGMLQKPLHPSELIFEFRSRLWVAVRRIEG